MCVCVSVHQLWLILFRTKPDFFPPLHEVQFEARQSHQFFHNQKSAQLIYFLNIDIDPSNKRDPNAKKNTHYMSTWATQKRIAEKQRLDEKINVQTLTIDDGGECQCKNATRKYCHRGVLFICFDSVSSVSLRSKPKTATTQYTLCFAVALVKLSTEKICYGNNKRPTKCAAPS